MSGDETIEALVDEPHCEECSTIPADGGPGWRWELAADGSRVLYCPDCWHREFGDARRRDCAPGQLPD